jgi:endonuclease/exonuclease/phosphatase (EEP) superfamily protein YafD
MEIRMVLLTCFARCYRPVTVTLGLVILWAQPVSADSANDAELSALLKKQTEEFSQAGQKGDVAVFDRYLDPEVVFTNETGSIATKKDLLESCVPPPANSGEHHIEVTNWVLHRQGDVATATFIDELTQDFHDQKIVLRFQSTETWAKRETGWKMIASQTMNVQRDPPAIALPVSELDEYVGTYQITPAIVVKIERDDTNLTTSTNGATPIALKVEMKDLLFIPGVPNLRRLFQRDSAGHVIGYISRRDGADLVFKKIA